MGRLRRHKNSNFEKRGRANPDPKKEGPTPTSSPRRANPQTTEEKEGPIPFPRVGGRAPSFAPRVRPGPPLQDRAWLLPYLSFWLGPWPSHPPLSGWLSPVGPGHTRPEGPTLTRKGRANLHPRKKADPYPGKGGPARQEGATLAPKIANTFPRRKGQPPRRERRAKTLSPRMKNQKRKKTTKNERKRQETCENEKLKKKKSLKTLNEKKTRKNKQKKKKKEEKENKKRKTHQTRKKDKTHKKNNKKKEKHNKKKKQIKQTEKQKNRKTHIFQIFKKLNFEKSKHPTFWSKGRP